MSLQTSLRATVPFDLTRPRPLVICQKMEMSEIKGGEMCVCRKHPEFCQHCNYYLPRGNWRGKGMGVSQYFWREQKWSISLAAPVIPFTWDLYTYLRYVDDGNCVAEEAPLGMRFDE